jgi:hypothetical protein
MDTKKIEELLKVDIIKELGLEGLDTESKQSIIDDAGYVMIRGAWIRLFEALSDAKQKELSDLLEEDPENIEAIIGFLKKEVPHYEDLIKEEVASYKSILLAQ